MYESWPPMEKDATPLYCALSGQLSAWSIHNFLPSRLVLGDFVNPVGEDCLVVPSTTGFTIEFYSAIIKSWAMGIDFFQWMTKRQKNYM